MPYISHHFEGRENSTIEEPPWGVEAKENGKDVKGGLLTSYMRMFQGLKGLPAIPIRNNTTNHFDPQNWRDKSSYKEQFFTPQQYSRHAIKQASVNRNHRPHPQSIVWPLEPFKGYMIWKPKIDMNSSDKKPYSAPSLLRHYNQNNWRTTTQTTYQNYFQGEEAGKSRLMEQKQPDIDSKLSSRMETRVLSREQIERKHTTPQHLRTTYRNNFVGDEGRPSTNARPNDYSWRNIKY